MGVFYKDALGREGVGGLWFIGRLVGTLQRALVCNGLYSTEFHVLRSICLATLLLLSLSYYEYSLWSILKKKEGSEANV